MSKSIGCKKINHSFTNDQNLVLEDVNLTVNAGEFVCILGPSGCGKSTLMNIVAGLIEPTGGEVLVGGENVSGPSSERGVVFQEFALMPWKTVRKNIEFGLRMKGIKGEQRRSIAQKFIDLVGLKGHEEQYPDQLSGGMKQRTAIARAYAVEPDILLMDEPFGALDAQTRSIMQDELLKSWQTLGQTVMFITHDLDEAFFLASRVIVMGVNPGSIIADIKVDFSYPRTGDIRFSDEFTQKKSVAWKLIEEQYTKSK